MINVDDLMIDALITFTVKILPPSDSQPLRNRASLRVYLSTADSNDHFLVRRKR